MSTHKKMMKIGRGVKVRVKVNFEDTSTPGEIRVQSWSQRERTLRAFKFGFGCWGGALVCLFIPLLHFILVPLFLIAGPIVAFFVIGQESVVVGGEGVCPKCQTFLPIARAAFRFPISDICSSCQCSLKIEPLGEIGEEGKV